MRQWTSDRFMAMWETSNGRDVNIVQALHDIHAIQVEENARQIRLQHMAEKLEALLQMPALPSPAIPSVHPPEPTAPEVQVTSPTPQDNEEEILAGDSKKRGGSAGLESMAKRQKV